MKWSCNAGNPALISDTHPPAVSTAGKLMSDLVRDRAAKVGDVLFRYMRARHRFKEKVEHPLPAHELAALIKQGKSEFDEIYIEPEAKPPIVFDGKADDVFDAIIKKRYRAIPFFDPELVAAWRHYVIGDGPMPRKPGPRRLQQGRHAQ